MFPWLNLATGLRKYLQWEWRINGACSCTCLHALIGRWYKSIKSSTGHTTNLKIMFQFPSLPTESNLFFIMRYHAILKLHLLHLNIEFRKIAGGVLVQYLLSIKKAKDEGTPAKDRQSKESGDQQRGSVKHSAFKRLKYIENYVGKIWAN